MNDCIFCKIVNKEIPAAIFHETEEFIAFVVTEPNNFGHSLVVPKKHFENIYSIEGKTSEALGEELKLVSKAIKETMHADGINIHMNNDAVAGQVIFHAHIHIIPRFKDDGLTHWSLKSYEYLEQRFDIGERIRATLS
ncbi:HIT family protein [soil metagenome]